MAAVASGSPTTMLLIGLGERPTTLAHPNEGTPCRSRLGASGSRRTDAGRRATSRHERTRVSRGRPRSEWRDRPYGALVDENAALGPVPVAWWRFLVLAAMLVALYFTIRAVSTAAQTHPALLVPGVLLGAAIGVLVGRGEAATLGAPERIGHRGRRRQRALPRSAARSAVAGLAGCGLILAQVLSTRAVEWVLLGGVALMVGGAGHAWVMARHHERVETRLND